MRPVKRASWILSLCAVSAFPILPHLGQAVSASSSGPLNLLCPCGYSKQIPSKFDGKKVVCPKCRNVLSVARVERAQLLTRCPYCGTAQRFDPKADSCTSCKKSFRLPKYIETLELKIASQMASLPMPTEEGSNDGLLVNVSTDSQPAIRPAPLRPRDRSLLWPIFVNFALLMGSFIVAWVVIGEKLGLPDPSTALGLKKSVPGRSTPDGGQEKQTAIDEQPPVASVPHVNSATIAPKLLAPSIAIIEGQFVVDQVLDQQTSKPVGFRTVIDLGLKNLTRCQIVNIAFKVACVTRDGNTTTIDIDNVKFSSGLMPEASGVMSLVCKSGNWEYVEVSIVSVESENDFDSTLIGPFKIESSDRLSN